MSNSNSRFVEVKRIFFLGDALGAYRTQYLLHYLLDRRFQVFYGSTNYLTVRRNYLNLFIRGTWGVLARLLYLLYADAVIVPALSRPKSSWLRLAHCLGKPILVDFYVSLYDTIVLDRQEHSTSSSAARRYRAQDALSLRLARPAIFLNRAEAKYYQRVVGTAVAPTNLRILPLCVAPRGSARLPFANGQQHTLTVAWWGTFIPLHGIVKIIEAARLLRDRAVPIVIYLFGNNEAKAQPYRTQIAAAGLESSVYIRNDATFTNGVLEAWLIDHADVALGSFGDSEKAGTVFLNKLADAFSLGLPAVSQLSQGLSELTETSQEVLAIANTAVALADALESLYDRPAHLLQMARAAHERYRSTFSPAAYARGLDNIFRTIPAE